MLFLRYIGVCHKRKEGGVTKQSGCAAVGVGGWLTLIAHALDSASPPELVTATTAAVPASSVIFHLFTGIEELSCSPWRELSSVADFSTSFVRQRNVFVTCVAASRRAPITAGNWQKAFGQEMSPTHCAGPGGSGTKSLHSLLPFCGQFVSLGVAVTCALKEFSQQESLGRTGELQWG